MVKRKTSQFGKRSFKSLECKTCGEVVENVDSKAVKVECSTCFMVKVPFEESTYVYVPTGRPRGWQWMAEFVDKDGTVFYKGKEQPKLKGTLPPTKVKKTTKPKKRKTKDEALVERYKKKLKAKRKSAIISAYKIKCSKCGEVRGTGKARKEKLIKEAGSLEKLEKTYLCRSCKRLKNKRKRK